MSAAASRGAGEGGVSLLAGFADAVRRWPDSTALVVGGAALTYAELSARAESIARALDTHAGDAPLVGLLAARSVTAYASLLGILARGRGYVPLNPAFPAQRNARMVQASEPDLVLVDAGGVRLLPELFGLVRKPTCFVLVDAYADAVEACQAAAGAHRVVAIDGDGKQGGVVISVVNPDAIAYVLFTSGSTGEPKGVVVSHANVLAYLEYALGAFGVGPTDRTSQNFDLTFDLSVHDIFVSLGSGASLHCPTTAETKLPGRFIRQHELTVWFCVPSVASVMSRLRMAKPDSYPSLRLSLFCGEGLPLATARTWQAAAPHSSLVNLYGPTEATIAITRFDVSPSLDDERCHGGVVPIGRAFPAQATAVVDATGAPVSVGEEGELCLGGTQVALGYWRDPERTGRQFVALPQVGEGRWYRTGDLVYEDADGALQYVGRLDHQVKIMGYRVELQEVENQLRKLMRFESVAALAWPVEAGIAEGIEVFVAGAGPDHPSSSEVIERCRAHLPTYMLPRGIHFIDDFPLNANGKLDRPALIQTYLSGEQGVA